MRAFIAGVLLLAGACQAEPLVRGEDQALGKSPTRAAIEGAMRESAAGWNRGDLDGFMSAYADDPTISFVSRDGVIRGKATIAARYAPSFKAGANKRGQLSFTFLEFRQIDPTHAYLVARYRLRTANGATEEGITSLLFERRTGGWRIVADHSG